LEFFIKTTCPSAPSPPPLILTKKTVGEWDRWQSGPFMQLDDEDNTEESNLSPPPIASLQWRMSRITRSKKMRREGTRWRRSSDRSHKCTTVAREGR
jgi:hypothetical protein